MRQKKHIKPLRAGIQKIQGKPINIEPPYYCRRKRKMKMENSAKKTQGITDKPVINQHKKQTKDREDRRLLSRIVRYGSTCVHAI